MKSHDERDPSAKLVHADSRRDAAAALFALDRFDEADQTIADT